jgi:hypothetical protein
MANRTLTVVLVLLLVCLGGLAQEALTNESILKLVKAGFGDDVIVNMVNAQPGKYSLSVDDTISLKQAGVSDKVLAAMIAKGSGSTAGTPAATAPPAVDPSLPRIEEVGVYYKKGGEWTEVLPEVVNWKTGGVLKNIATVGVVKKDVNGNLNGPHSRNSVAVPAEFVIYMPEGVAITEYQLLRLRAKNDYREFRTVTGGVFNAKSGATRDIVPFEGKKLASRMYSVIFPSNLGFGEYGFIYLGAAGGAGGMTSLSMGKMYTFRVVE